jgi:hypothetical protein
MGLPHPIVHPEGEVMSIPTTQVSDQATCQVNLGRHEAQCSVCNHPKREVIEGLWLNWGNTSALAREYDLSRYALYRHAHAKGLVDKRNRNIRAALTKMIEKMDATPMSGGAILGAIKLLLELTKQTEATTERKEVTPQQLFERMTQEERKAFATDGSLPTWYAENKVATPVHSQEAPKQAQGTENTTVQ